MCVYMLYATKRVISGGLDPGTLILVAVRFVSFIFTEYIEKLITDQFND